MIASKYNVLFDLEDKHYLFNLASQALLEVDKDTVAFLKKPTENYGLTDVDIKELEANGIVVSSHEFELARMKFNVNALRYGQNKMGVFISMTPDCNLQCTYCYQDARKEKSEKQCLTPENWNKIFTHFKNKIERDHVEMMFVSLFGGEPMMDDKILERVILDLDSLRSDKFIVRMSMITNGTLFTEENVDICLNYLNNIQITMDGPKDVNDKFRIKADGSGSFDMIHKGLLLLASRSGKYPNCEITLRVNVTNESVKRGIEFVDWVVHEKLDKTIAALIFHEVFDSQCEISSTGGQSEYSNVELAKEINKLNFYIASKGMRTFKNFGGPCLAKISNGFAIDEELEVYACPGTLYEKPCGHLTNGEIEITEKEWFDFVNNDPDCIDTCKYAPICYGGCNWVSNQQEKNCRVKIWQATIVPQLQAYVLSTYVNQAKKDIS